MTPMASKSNIDLMNHISDMLLHLNILNMALRDFVFSPKKTLPDFAPEPHWGTYVPRPSGSASF